MPLSAFRDHISRPLYVACANLDLYFVTLLPVQVSGTPLGMLLIGSREPNDVETTRGQQLMATVASQAATVVHNTSLMEALARRELEANHDRIFRKTLLDTMADGLLVCSTHGQVRFANHRLSMMTGYDVEALQDMAIAELFAPEDREELLKVVTHPDPPQTASFEMNLLCANGDTMPVLTVQARQPITQNGDDQERVIVMTDLTDLKQREQAITRQSQQLSALIHATQAITSTLSLNEAIHAILSEATSVLDATSASVQLLTPAGDELEFHTAVGPNADKLTGVTVPIEQGVGGYVVREGEPQLVPDAYNDRRFYREIDKITGNKTESIAAVPLVLDGTTIGVIEVLNKQNAAFDQTDLEILESLARSAAVALGNTKLYGEAQQRVRELTVLLTTSEAASSTLAIEQILESVARQLGEALSAQWCAISSWDRPTDTVRRLADISDIEWPADQPHTVDVSQQADVMEAIQTCKPANQTHSDPEEPWDILGAVPNSGLTARLLLPITIEESVFGLAEMCHYVEQELFSDEDVERCLTTLIAWQQSLELPELWSEADNARQLASRLLRVTGASTVSVFAYDADMQSLLPLHQISKVVWPLEKGPSYPLDNISLRRVALIERTPVTVDLARAELSNSDRQALPRTEGAMLITPLMGRGEAIGLVELLDINPGRRFTDDDLSLAQAIGNVVGNALQNARLYGTLLWRAAQLEAAYNDLQEADRLKAEWIQNVSHELRTPLTSIMGYVDLLLEGDLGPLTDDQREAIEIIIGKGRQLAALVNDMLTIQKIERGQLDRAQVPIQELIDGAVQALEPMAQQTGIKIVTRYRGDPETIYADARLLSQAVEHLLSNAIKFSPKGSEVLIQVEDIGPAVQAEIIDHGIGIPVEEQDKIWRRFYQIDGSMTRQFGGTGLGLAVVKQVIEKHGGRVWVRSEPGNGSHFGFILPKQNSRTEPQDTPEQPADA